jgi:hypothetical protein
LSRPVAIVLSGKGITGCNSEPTHHVEHPISS